jgi:ribonuclease BN (tRNA processing enzyme)
MHRFGVAPAAVDAVVVTHLHGDHFAGLPFLLLDAAFISRRTRRLIVAGPPGLAERLQQTSDAFFPGFWERYAKRLALEFVVLRDAQPVRIAGATVTPFQVIHDSGAPAFAVRISTAGRTVAYSGDTAWTERLVEAARGADLFLCEASSFENPIPNHLTYRIIAAERARLGASRIVLTHLGPDVLSRRRRLAFEAAEDGKTYVLGARPRRRSSS